MATNVTEKDKTLREVIAYCDQAMQNEFKLLHFCKLKNKLLQFFTLKNNADGEIWHDGCATAYRMVMEHCESMLGYGGTMPDEVPNQSEDAKQEAGNA